MSVALYSDWTNGRSVPTLGTNAGAITLPFQRWMHFKESFAPEFVESAIAATKRDVEHCLDPFGGSGTTALTCQLLGVRPTTIEVNPFLYDLIVSKLDTYDLDRVAFLAEQVVEVSSGKNDLVKLENIPGPTTLVEPGKDGRWIFNRDVAKQVFAIRDAILDLSEDANVRRLFLVLLGGILVECSNIRISGKGRRYRNNWKNRPVSGSDVLDKFITSIGNAVSDIARFRNRLTIERTILLGDSRKRVSDVDDVDAVIFSPPYPNSFDYTDVYNVELWMLGYLSDFEANRSLRTATLNSHVQIKRSYPKPPTSSKTLGLALANLDSERAKLWNKDIPEMVGGYFHDLAQILEKVKVKLRTNGQVHMVVGDSRYASVQIPVADILIEIGKGLGYEVLGTEPFRSMRTSSQQGGNELLAESRIVLG